MAKTDTYEILPQDILDTLRYDIEALKKKLDEPQSKTNELILEIESLKDSIHDLNDVFKKALHETAEEDVYKTLKVISERIDAVVTQNETIAKGMIAISDKVDDFVSSQNNKPASAPAVNLGGPAGSMGSAAAPMGAPRNLPPQMSAIQGSGRPAVPMSGMGARPGGVPPPPPSMGGAKKRSFF